MIVRIPKNLLYLGIIILLFFIATLFLYIQPDSPKKNSNLSPQSQKPFAVKITPSTHAYKVLYGKGTNIIYTSNTPYSFSGSGLVETLGADNKTYIGYIVGLFQRFESISNSSDKYIILKEYNSKKLYTVRTHWNVNEGNATDVIKEDLNQIGDTVVGRGYLQRLGSVNEETSLFTPGKVVTILLKTIKVDTIDKEAIKDQNGNYEAQWIIVR